MACSALGRGFSYGRSDQLESGRHPWSTETGDHKRDDDYIMTIYNQSATNTDLAKSFSHNRLERSIGSVLC